MLQSHLKSHSKDDSAQLHNTDILNRNDITYKETAITTTTTTTEWGVIEFR